MYHISVVVNQRVRFINSRLKEGSRQMTSSQWKDFNKSKLEWELMENALKLKEFDLITPKLILNTLDRLFKDVRSESSENDTLQNEYLFNVNMAMKELNELPLGAKTKLIVSVALDCAECI